MKKILFLPLLQTPTGHHQVADALIRSLQKRMTGIEFKKIDLLSYMDTHLEKVVSRTYLKWINYSPNTYEWVYKYFVYPSNSNKHLQIYELFFLKKTLELLLQERPDLIVCTQAFPSFLVSRLKSMGKLEIPVINVYTDFFINKVWGIAGIDWHLVPNCSLKEELSNTYKVNSEHIIITGIPVDEHFKPNPAKNSTSSPYHILVAGGNSGLGNILDTIKNSINSKKLYFSILCGKNLKLFKEINSWKAENIRPLPYISSRKEMNYHYNQTDLIMTKPGGVTISEALAKRLPIIVHSALPGQEEVNWKYLSSKGLVYSLASNSPLEPQLDKILNNTSKTYWNSQIEKYYDELEAPAWKVILNLAAQTSAAVE